jgi:hypothetical protein
MQDTKDEIVFWYYKSNVRPWSETASNDLIEAEWTKYRDIEIDIIEEAYQQGKPDAILDRYSIDLINFIQVRLDDNQKQRPIKREIGQNRKECLRENRFYYKSAVVSTTPGSSSSSYGAFDSWCPFLKAWFETSKGRRAWLQLSSCIEASAQGIIQEAREHGRNAEAAYMAEKIRQCSGRSRREATELCMRLYTKDSFLYDALNKALRQCDLAKLDTLGPIAFLISNYSHAGNEFVGTVYRGVEFAHSENEAYKQAIGRWKSWPAYTSTSKNRALAEMYGHTLFIIEITDIKLSAPRSFDISNLSYYPAEEEVLLPPGMSFRIIDVEQTSEEKWIISIRI